MARLPCVRFVYKVTARSDLDVAVGTGQVELTEQSEKLVRSQSGLPND